MRKIAPAGLILLGLFGLTILAQTSSQESTQVKKAPIPRVTIDALSGPILGPHLIQRVTARYPPEAKAARIEGTVVLDVVVGVDGAVTSVVSKSGPEALAPAAIEVVKQWKYEPSEFNGHPVEVALPVTINFRFQN